MLQIVVSWSVKTAVFGSMVQQTAFHLARHALHAVSKDGHSKDMDEILNEIENKKKGDA